MKIAGKSLPPLLVVILLGIDPVFTTSLPASEPAQVAHGAVATKPAEDWLFDVDFPGGTIQQLLTSLRQGGATFNLVGEKEDMETMLPPFSFRGVDSNTLALSLRALLSPRGLTIEGATIAPPARGIFVLHRLDPIQVSARTTVFSFQLAPFLGGQTEKDIMDAIRIAWALDPSHRPEQLRLQYHSATGLLLVFGADQGQVVAQVIGTLNRAAGTEASRSGK